MWMIFIYLMIRVKLTLQMAGVLKSQIIRLKCPNSHT